MWGVVQLLLKRFKFLQFLLGKIPSSHRDENTRNRIIFGRETFRCSYSEHFFCLRHIFHSRLD